MSKMSWFQTSLTRTRMAPAAPLASQAGAKRSASSGSTTCRPRFESRKRRIMNCLLTVSNHILLRVRRGRRSWWRPRWRTRTCSTTSSTPSSAATSSCRGSSTGEQHSYGFTTSIFGPELSPPCLTPCRRAGPVRLSHPRYFMYFIPIISLQRQGEAGRRQRPDGGREETGGHREGAGSAGCRHQRPHTG